MDFNKAFDFPVLLNRAFLLWMSVFNILLLRHLTKFLVKVCIVVYCTRNFVQFGGCLIKIKQILNILQEFQQNLEFSVSSNWAIFSLDFVT